MHEVFNTCVGLFCGFVWNNEGVQHAAIFDRLFRGCQHGVGEGICERSSIAGDLPISEYCAASMKMVALSFLHCNFRD